MKSILITITLFLLVSYSFGQQAEIAPSGGVQQIYLSQGQSAPALFSSGNIIFDNGPLVNSPGTGPGGTDQSVLQGVSLGMNTIGFGFQSSANNWVADDFSISGVSHISSILLYGYQTGSTTTSTITAAYIKIYDDRPDLPGANIVWGDAVTNRMISSQFSGIYRITETNNDTNRPIMEVVCGVDIHLPEGTYWIEFQLDGALGSGPWCPPITVAGETTTGNGLQLVSTGYQNLNDSGSITQQGAPFVLIGTSVVPVSFWYIFLIFPLLGFIIFLRRKM
jgi:hypothetical protein